MCKNAYAMYKNEVVMKRNFEKIDYHSDNLAIVEINDITLRFNVQSFYKNAIFHFSNLSTFSMSRQRCIIIHVYAIAIFVFSVLNQCFYGFKLDFVTYNLFTLFSVRLVTIPVIIQVKK